MNLEDEMTIDELRCAVRAEWDRALAFKHDIADLPEVPSYTTLIMLSNGGFPLFWKHGKSEQSRLYNEPDNRVPYKTECEIGMGRWKFIRDALRAAQGIEAGTAETGTGSVHESPVACDAPQGGIHDPSQ